jgi:antitoxin component HigA of HigAB toxin-antitoxin module
MYQARISVLLLDVDNLNDALTAALRAFMTDHGITQQAVALHLDRSKDYVSGRLSGRHALSVDIVTAVAQLAGLSDHAVMADVMIRSARIGQGSSDR